MIVGGCYQSGHASQCVRWSIALNLVELRSYFFETPRCAIFVHHVDPEVYLVRQERRVNSRNLERSEKYPRRKEWLLEHRGAWERSD